jgi:ATP-dependent DNA helicase PIF1
VFFTGAAGCGKSFILRILKQILTKLDLQGEIQFCAPTGIAACNIGGLTIHSWAGIGLANKSLENIVGQVMGTTTAVKRWRNTSILVIDEVSMLSAELFDMLSFIGSRVRQNDQPFGGIQLVLCGDFFQLPPIGLGKDKHFCFESLVWKKMLGTKSMIILDKSFRQQEGSFLSILNEIRYGKVSASARRILIDKVRETSQKRLSAVASTVEEVKPTKLFSRNVDVDEYNTTELEKLKGEPHVYLAKDVGKEPYLHQLQQNVKAPEQLVLKVGAQVMLLKNIDTAIGLVNGARGVVTRFIDAEEITNSMGAPTTIFKRRKVPVVEFKCLVAGVERKQPVLR